MTPPPATTSAEAAGEGRVIALDFAKRCGWAIGADGRFLDAGTEDFTPKRGDSLGLRWMLFRRKFVELLDEQQPDLVVWEQAFIGAMKSKYVAEWALGFRALAQEECDRRGVAYREINNAQIKLYATGKGNATKEEMQAAAKVKWPAYDAKKDDGANEADAAHLLSYALAGFPVLEGATARKARERREAKVRAAQERNALLHRLAENLVGAFPRQPLTVLGAEAEKAGYSRAGFRRALRALEMEGGAVKAGKGWELA